jgi:hypothetical protein
MQVKICTGFPCCFGQSPDSEQCGLVVTVNTDEFQALDHVGRRGVRYKGVQ